jgi:hypothetical protein
MKSTSKITLLMVTMMFFVSSLIPNATYAQKAVFSNCSLEHNVKDEKTGHKKMVCHFTAEFTGMKQHDAQITMQIESPKGEIHEYLDDDYGGDGRLRLPVWKVKEFKNKNKTDSFSLKNKIIWMWNSDIHPKKGKNKYYVRLVAYDLNTNEEVGSSEYMSFTMTGK